MYKKRKMIGGLAGLLLSGSWLFGWWFPVNVNAAEIKAVDERIGQQIFGEQIQLTRIVPDTLDDQIVYPTNHATVELDPLYTYKWLAIEIPVEWRGQGYYYEVWDSRNKPVPQYQAKRLENGNRFIDISAIDASLYPQIRLIIFKPDAVPELAYAVPIRFHYTQRLNYGFFGLTLSIILLYGLFAMAALHYKIGWRDLARGTYRLLYPVGSDDASIRKIIVHGCVTMLWAGLFGVVLGNVAGGMQILYVLIKLPFLLLSALLGTVISLAVLSQLLQLKKTWLDIADQAMELVAITAIALASLSGIIVFYTYLPQNHDVILVTTMLCMTAAGGLAAYRLSVWLHPLPVVARLIIVVVWVTVYGMVFLQLGWQLRPWVGVIDPLHNSVPFVRSGAGNVFVEAWNAIQRSH